jgi:hypothetical protein
MALGEFATGVTIMAAFLSGAWVLGSYVVENLRQKTNLIVGLYQQYFAKEMMQARLRAWFALARYNKSRPVKFYAIWSNQEIAEDVDALYRVLAFYHSLYVLDKLGRLHRGLAKEFFSYQFAHWSRQFRPLVEDTMRYDDDQPELLRAFGKRLQWLGRHARIYDPVEDA